MRKHKKYLDKIIKKYGDQCFMAEDIKECGVPAESYNYLLSIGCLEEITLSFGNIKAIRLTPYGRSYRDHAKVRAKEIFINAMISFGVALGVSVLAEIIKGIFLK